MFGIGSWEIVVILVVALLVLGPDQLPKIAKLVGKAMREVRRASSELRLNLEVDDLPPRPRPVDDQALAKLEVERTPTSTPATDPYAAPEPSAPPVASGDGAPVDKPPEPKAG